MAPDDLRALLPFMILAASPVAVILAIAFYRGHALSFIISIAGLLISFGSLFYSFRYAPRAVTPLLIIDRYSLFFTGLILLATLAVSLISFGYLENRSYRRGEYYALLLSAALGASTLVASSHFASFFLGLEILSLSLYAMVAYTRGSRFSLEAAFKYLVLASVSSAFLLFGMALIYSYAGTMELAGLALVSRAGPSVFATAGLAMMLVGIGFKLALAPFHMWTPDVYEGAPAPVSAFVATVSKGAVFALLVRYFSAFSLHDYPYLFWVLAGISILSMLIGNLLALLQNNVKRILAYSSISQLGYLLVAFLASGPQSFAAVSYYLASYFVAMLGSFGIVAVLAGPRGELVNLEDYQGLVWNRPWLAGIFTGMLLSLAGLPLTAGFIAKFYIVSAGVQAGQWALVLVLAASSVIGLFYYVRVIAAMYSKRLEAVPYGEVPVGGGIAVAVLTVALLWLGIWPSTLIGIIQRMIYGN